MNHDSSKTIQTDLMKINKKKPCYANMSYIHREFYFFLHVNDALFDPIPKLFYDFESIYVLNQPRFHAQILFFSFINSSLNFIFR